MINVINHNEVGHKSHAYSFFPLGMILQKEFLTMLRPIYIIFISVIPLSCGKQMENTIPRTLPLTEAVYASGNIKAFNQYEVFSNVNGILKGQFVEENDTVFAGEVLAEIENDVTKFQLENAQVLLEDAGRNVGPNSPVIDQINLEIENARLKLKNDSINWERYSHLLIENAATQSEVENRELIYKTSRNSVFELLKKKADTKNYLEIQYKNALNTVKVNASNKSDRIVKSLINGKVYRFYKEPGEMVQAQQPIALIGDKKRFILELIVDELDINKIKVGQVTLVTLDTYGDVVFKAKVTKIFPMLDIKTQTFKIEAEFINVPENLYPGLTAESNIIIREKSKALVIPRSFLFPGDSVIVNKSEKRKVKIGLKSLEYVEILSGIDSLTSIYR